jgi:AcrR family transcriptional regulator
VVKQAERSSATRLAIVEAAGLLFTERGYSATSITDILDATGISRGALYHHFPSKEDIFAVVFLKTSADAIRRAGKRTKPQETPLATLIAGCLAWIDIATEPSVARVLFQDGPLALGWERCRTLEETTSLAAMRPSIRAAVESGELEVDSVDVVARLINSLLAEAALDLLRTGGRSRKRQMVSMITAMITGLSAR